MASKEYEPTMLGRWLRHCRGSLSQEDVAGRYRELYGKMHQSEWSKWESGERKRATPEKLVRFTHTLNVPVETMALAYADLWPLDYGDIADRPTRGPLTPHDLFAAASMLSERLTHQAEATIQEWVMITFGIPAEAPSPARMDNTAERAQASSDNKRLTSNV